MKVAEFKLWFKGMTAGMVSGQGLSAGQLEVLKKEISTLESDDQVGSVKGTDKEPLDTSPPAKGVESFIEELRRQYEEIPKFPRYKGPPDWDREYWLLPEDLIQTHRFRN